MQFSVVIYFLLLFHFIASHVISLCVKQFESASCMKNATWINVPCIALPGPDSFVVLRQAAHLLVEARGPPRGGDQLLQPRLLHPQGGLDVEEDHGAQHVKRTPPR